MSFINLDQLPFVGMSYEFVGETQGAPFSAYIVTAKPGQGPPLHTHPYVEVAFTIDGCDTTLRQIDVHASPAFIQTNLT